MSSTYYIQAGILDLETIHTILSDKSKLALSEEARVLIQKGRSYLDAKTKGNNKPFYGINTGFGSLCNIRIDGSRLQDLQEHLVMSHACGSGQEVPEEIVKLMLLLKIQSLSYGHSGVQTATVERLIDFYNNDCIPVVFTQGSLGASGDLAPLAHLALPLLGKGEIRYKGNKITAAEIHSAMGWEPVQLQSKEGLALLNGTQFMSAYGIWILLRSYRLSYLADCIGTLSLEAFDGLAEPFHSHIHQVRPHRGQVLTAKRVRNLLEGSDLQKNDKPQVQDPYSFRCIPQVHGACKDVLAHVRQVFKTEINSVTDNPNIFPDEDLILSGGNFHGQPLAMALDYLGIALSEWASISERRTYQLISGQRGLPAFLVNDPGVNSGLMIPQYTAAGIVSENKQLATPASVDSIVSSNGQEDHVSMGANAATKCFRIAENTTMVLAIELMNAAQALAFRRPGKTSEELESFYASFLTEVPFIAQDRILHDDMIRAKLFLEKVSLPSFIFEY